MTLKKLEDPINRHCRIGKVSYKTAQIFTFPEKDIHPIKKEILSAAREITNELPNIDGYISIAWEPGMSGAIRLFCHPGNDRTMLDMPGFVSELIRWSFKK